MSEGREGAWVYRTRPQRVQSIYYTGKNTTEVIKWLKRIDNGLCSVSGDFEEDPDTLVMVDCRLVDVNTRYGWDELSEHCYVIRFDDNTVDVISGDEFEDRFVLLAPDKDEEEKLCEF